MIAEHAIDRSLNACQDRSHACKSIIKFAERRATIIAGKNTQIIAQPGSICSSRPIAPSFMSAWKSLMCSSVKPSKAGGSFFERISLCLTCTRAALARPRQYNPVNLKRVRMTEWIEYQFSMWKNVRPWPKI